MTKSKKKIFPKLKKKISSFLTDESWKISKKDALGLAVWAVLLAWVDSVIADHQNSANHNNTCNYDQANHKITVETVSVPWPYTNVTTPAVNTTREGQHTNAPAFHSQWYFNHQNWPQRHDYTTGHYSPLAWSVMCDIEICEWSIVAWWAPSHASWIVNWHYNVDVSWSAWSDCTDLIKLNWHSSHVNHGNY